MAKKKSQRALSAGMGLSPWSPHQIPTAMDNGPMIPIQEDLSQFQNNGLGASTMDDIAAQKYLESLSMANSADGQPAPPRAPAPEPAPSPVPGGEIAGVSMPGSDEVLAPGQKPSTDLNMAGITVLSDGQAKPDAMPKVVPYEKHLKEQLDKANRQRKVDKNLNYSGEEFARLKRQKMGITSPQLTDENGNPVFQKVLVTDEKGQPLLDDKGAPVYMQGDPVYDDSKQIVDPNDPYQLASRGINEQQRTLSQLLESARPQMDLSPLMAWAGALADKPGFASSYKAPTKYSEILENAMKARKGLIDQQAAMNKEANDIRDLKSGNAQDLASQLLQMRLLDESGMKPDTMGSRMEMQEERLANQTHRENVRMLKNNKPLMQILGTYQTLGNNLGVLANAKNLTPQQITEVQQRIRQALGAGVNSQGSTGMERAEATAKTLDWSIAGIKQFLTSKPADIAKDGELLQHLAEVATIEQESLKHLYNKRIEAVTGGQNWLYEDPRFQRYKDSLDAIVGTYHGLPDASGPTPMANPGAAKRVTGKIHQQATADRRRERLATEKAQGPTPRQQEIERLRKELGL